MLHVEPDTVASTGFAVLRAKGGDWAWVYETTHTDAFVGYLEGRATGAAYPAVTGVVFEEAPILVPPADLRMRFQAAAGPIHSLKALLGEQNTRLRAARDLLLPKLISGEIDLRTAEADVEAAA